MINISSSNVSASPALWHSTMSTPGINSYKDMNTNKPSDAQRADTGVKPTPLDWARYRDRKRANVAAEKQKQAAAAERREEKEEHKRKREEDEETLLPPKLTKSQMRNRRKRAKLARGDEQQGEEEPDEPSVEMEVDEKKPEFVLSLRPASQPYVCPGKMNAKWDDKKKCVVNSGTM
ncbi:hypothetical protein HBH56_021200 [Parastagonospora nodorum]|uniref:Uncharacterized protein n=1 Tax=Phaeosphaeria nodorum (strain SN15 / ATCC MYA-4574 / FGSC 10173) TaxID=321614 RepID=A0A7U2EYN3_PHANO|nr:hypothetical protein HBH56_021200 [Parastagonospora nodorum]QRC95485.1 hypothetical protein JI435_031690 [Parastagonospora nodorum SN15]KAH3937510.1 hypothetical protein HBH54_013290 [Parastagonospora nodorum]KAH3944021.1 hypothetical protein HBH53_163460 [Parastagonospora nodorum]KAH3967663.1 hypothetical protein HBH51_137020 [Parastagonospora nodorum]